MNYHTIPHLGFARSLLIAVYLMLLPGMASAYIDPGSGMLLIQGLVALVGALIVFARNPIKAIKALIARWRSQAK